MWVSSKKESSEQTTMKYIHNPELISFHIMAFHTHKLEKQRRRRRQKNCTPWRRRKKVVNDLLHPFKPSFPNWFIFAAVIKNISLHPWKQQAEYNLRSKEENKQTSVRKDMLQDLCFLLTALEFMMLWLAKTEESEVDEWRKEIAFSFIWFWRMTRWKERASDKVDIERSCDPLRRWGGGLAFASSQQIALTFVFHLHEALQASVEGEERPRRRKRRLMIRGKSHFTRPLI